DEVESFGIRGQVFRPSIIPVEIKVRLIFEKTVIDADKQFAISQAETTLKTYINSRNVGEPIEIKEINEQIKAIHEGIQEIIIFQYRINNRPVLVVDQKCAWNERFVE